MEIISCDEERWALINSDDEEALSLCDLPLIHHENEEDVNLLRPIETQDDFDFCSKESEMCAADEVFHQGQILPFRRSTSCKKGFLQYCATRNFGRSISKSESMDNYSSVGLISSRSSSIGSHQSSSSSSGSSTATTDPKPPRNQFHSHPSPSPRTFFPNKTRGLTRNNMSRNSVKKSSAWNIFRLGLLAAPPPEIAFHDLKTRPGRNIGSRNNNSSNSTSKKNISRKDFLLAGCKCSMDAVDTVPPKVVFIKRSVSDGGAETRELQVEAENFLEIKSPKKRSSHRRTFEWLKELSLEEDEP